MTKLDKTAIDKAKEMLGETGQNSPEELYDKLYEYRNSLHPDRFQDDESKKIAEEKFKDVGNALENLKKTIELQLVEKKPSEIIPFQKTYDIIQLKQTNVDYQNEIKSLKYDIDLLKYENKDLKKEIKNLRNQKLKEKTDELIEQYRPTKKGLFSNGIIFILTLIGGILTKVQDIALFIFKYSPIPENIVHYIIFTILIFIPLRLLYQFLKQNSIEKISQLIITPPMLKIFLDELVSQKKTDEFNELDVYNFISRIKYPKNSLGRWFVNKIFATHSYRVINILKDIFIYNMLSKQLIEISRADRLDRNFKIVKGYYHFSFVSDDDNKDDETF